ARAASSAFLGQPSPRDASAIPAPATTHRARASASFGLNARAARRPSTFSRTHSPTSVTATSPPPSAAPSARRPSPVLPPPPPPRPTAPPPPPRRPRTARARGRE
ncbi:hypothetical protein CF640_36855, partial [Burkholderia pseudomallei]